MTALLFSETGVRPLRVRQAGLAVRYLLYLVLESGESMLVHAALTRILKLDWEGQTGWIAELRGVVESLPCWQGTFPFHAELAIEVGSRNCQGWFGQRRVRGCTGKFRAPRGFICCMGEWSWTERGIRCAQCQCCFVTISTFRTASIGRRSRVQSLVHSKTALACSATRVPREAMLCRFRVREVESSDHVWFECEGNANLPMLM